MTIDSLKPDTRTSDRNSNEVDALTLRELRPGPEETASSPGPTRAVDLGFIDLASENHNRPLADVEYSVVHVSSDALESLPVPKTDLRLLDLDVLALYCWDFPDSTSTNEGLLTIQMNAKDPQDNDADSELATCATYFSVNDRSYAPGFLLRAGFRNIVIQHWISVNIDLKELDGDFADTYAKISDLLDRAGVTSTVDGLSSVPYLKIGTALVDGLIRIFGKNPDDHLWGEVPILEIDPLIGGGFLRSGLYVLFERESRENSVVHRFSVDELRYKNGRVLKVGDAPNGLTQAATNHAVFSVRLREFTPPIRIDDPMRTPRSS